MQCMIVFDVFATILWMAMMFTFTDDWYLFVPYWCLSLSRLITGYWYIENDCYNSRRNYYFAHVISDICFGILFMVHFFVYLAKYQEFPVLFLLWQISLCFIYLYFLLVARQHFINKASGKNELAWDFKNPIH